MLIRTAAPARYLNKANMFTYQYTQPPEYHFSLYTIHLAEYLAQQLKPFPGLPALRVLDLCAGCGVLGIELSFYLRALTHIDFIEVQEIYTDYFNQNTERVNRPELKLHWHLLNYEELLKPEWANTYDLIISNPPYFQAGHGMLSPSEFKNRCRFFLDSTFPHFILAIMNSLTADGQAYFLLRSLKQHGYDAFSEVQALIKGQPFSAEIITQIRGTDVVLLKKLYS